MAMIEFRRVEIDKVEATAPVRAALRSLFGRIGRPVPSGSHDAFDDLADASGTEQAALATRFENKVQAMRANAHAAFDSVQGSVHQAVEAALAVVEAEWRSCRSERDSYAEALKAIRVYAADARARELAEGALARRPAAAGWDAALHVAGRDRYPFLGEFDA
jgi:hypothetical protein